MRYSKSLYLDDDNPIDAALKPVAQKQLRQRLRTGHILHTLLGDALASNLHDFLRIPADQRMDALMDLIQHHTKMQQRMIDSPRPGNTPDQPTDTFTEETQEGDTNNTTQTQHGFRMIGA